MYVKKRINQCMPALIVYYETLRKLVKSSRVMRNYECDTSRFSVVSREALQKAIDMEGNKLGWN